MQKIISIIILLTSQQLWASPEINICSSDCEIKQTIALGEQTWTDIVTSFSVKSTSDEEERKQLAQAIKLIEVDIIQQSIKLLKQKGDSELVSLSFSSKDEKHNTRQSLILLLDHRLVSRHLLRNSLKRSAWYIKDESAVAIQSIKNGDIYIVDSVSTPFGEEPAIMPYAMWKNEKTAKQIPKNIARLLNSLTADSIPDAAE